MKKVLMKCVYLVLIVVIAISIPLMSGCVARPAPTEPTTPTEELPLYTFRVQSVFGPAQNEELVRPWLDDVEAALGGRGVFELYGSAELVPDDQVLSALAAGTIDIAFSFDKQLGSPIDVAEIAAVPAFGWKSNAELMALWQRKGLKEIYTEAYNELPGIHFWGLMPTDPMHIISTKPITKYEDIEGLKISGPATNCGPFLAAGAVSVFIPVEEFYLAGKTGVCDAQMWGGATEAYTNSWNEVYPYFLTNPVNGAALCFWLFSDKTWQSLPDDVQAILDRSIQDLQLRSLTYYYDGECRYRNFFNLTTMPDEDWAKLVALSDDWWDEMREISPRNAKVVKIIEDYNKEVDAAGWFR